MTMRKANTTFAGIVFLYAALSHPFCAAAQLISNISLNEGVDADNDFPPGGASTQNSVTDTVVPFQKTISANDGTGSMVTGTFELTDNGQVASFTAFASGVLTANGNDFGAGTFPAGTTFQLLQPVSYIAHITCNGSAGVGNNIVADLDLNENDVLLFQVGASGVFPSNTIGGTLPPGLIDLGDSWGIGYNNATTYPASESGTYSLTLTFTAIPEPSSATLLTIPTAALLLRRRRVTLVGG